VSDRRRPLVLVVDDSLTVRMHLGETLESAGFDVQLCPDLASARQTLAGASCSLVVLDLLLPDGHGLDFLRELKESPATAGIPVMLLSSEAEVRSRVRGMTAGADEYLGKPYDVGQLVARARALVQEPPPSPAGDSRRRVLIIDDSATFRGELKHALEESGFAVAEAETGEAGLALAVALRPDAVVVDGMLPGIDGPTVVRRLKSDVSLRATPCLLLTASEGAGEELRSLEAGADAYLRKSDDLGLIQVRLAALLRGAVPMGAEGGPSLLGPKRLLAVDDSATYRQTLAEQLRQEGYDVVLAASGEEALELLGVQTIDCILLDLVMPGLSGQETCRRIKQSARWRDIPLVMLTGREDREAMIEGINAGADDYIAKSADFEVLKARLRAQLRRKHFEDENRRIHEELVRLNERTLAEQKMNDYALALEQSNRQLAQARERAEEESRFKSRFLANMSHELRTPLNAIIGFSELLEEEMFGPLIPRQKEYVQHVLAGGRHLLNLVNDILDISKIEAGRMQLRREWTPLGPIVESARGLVRPLADKGSIKIEVQLPATLPDLYVDPVRVKQILYNLLSNAIKFSSPGGVVALTAAIDGPGLMVSCRDTGRGIRREDLPRLFREFEQLDPAEGQGSREGTGLGLALTRRLVELHGGSISAISELGQGSTFSFTIPTLRGVAAEGEPLQAPLADPDVGLVLVIEDDPRASDLIGGHLRSAGLAMAVARNAQEAIDLAERLRPLAITLDVLMPGVDGWAILGRLKNVVATRDIPVFIVSVVDDHNRGLLLGAIDYLIKPVSRESLLQALEAAGVPVQRVAGLRVLLAGEGDGDIDEIEAHLRQAGCQVQRAVDPPADLVTAEVDLLLINFAANPAGAFACLLRLAPDAQALPLPVLAIVDPGTGGEGRWRGTVDRMARADALTPEKLVRLVRQAVDTRKRGRSVGSGEGAPPSRVALGGQLQSTIQRAEREFKRVALVVVKANLRDVAVDQLGRSQVRSGDYTAVVAEDAIALVVCGASEADTGGLARRFGALVETQLGLSTRGAQVFLHPRDGATGAELLQSALDWIAGEEGSGGQQDSDRRR
jgi:two-component system, NtrC family, sensor kinase